MTLLNCGYYFTEGMEMQKLPLKTKMNRVDGSIYKFFEKLSKSDLLILDDFGLANLEQQQRMDFMKIIEDRHARKATIIASQRN